MARWARRSRRFDHARAQTLARHFHKAKAGNATNLDTRAIRLQLVLHALFNRCVVLTLVHVDEVDDDQARKVTQTQLTRHFFGRFKVGLGRCVLNGAFFGRTTRVHVNRNQGFGGVNHDITARFQLYGRIKHTRQIAFHLITREQWHGLRVELHVFRVRRHDHLHKVFRRAISALAFNKHFIDVAVIKIADRTFDQIAFLINLRGGDRFKGQFANLLPKALQIFVVALDLSLGAFGTSGAHNQSSTLGHFYFVRYLFEFLTIYGVGDLAGNAATTSSVWHKNAVTPCQRQVGR